MAILIGCEESQTICGEFRKHGYEAFSCDIVETRGNPEWHYQCDIVDIVSSRKWDLIILHPDCTALALSGNAWYGKGRPRHSERLDAIEWTLALWEYAKEYSDRVALENPGSVIFGYLKNTQYIQPWQFGHGETKLTGLALHNPPFLEPTNTVDGRETRILNMGPSPTRKRDRSVTYKGIAEAIVQQWGSLINRSN